MSFVLGAWPIAIKAHYKGMGRNQQPWPWKLKCRRTTLGFNRSGVDYQQGYNELLPTTKITGEYGIRTFGLFSDTSTYPQ